MSNKGWQALQSKDLFWSVSGGAIILEKDEKALALFIFEELDELNQADFKQQLDFYQSDPSVQYKFIGRSHNRNYEVLSKIEFHRVITREEPFELIYSSAQKKFKVNKVASAGDTTRVEPKKTRVLIVDDSATIRNVLKKILSSDPEIEVVGLCEGPELVEKAILDLRPDVMTLDIHMPGQDGVSLLKDLMPRHYIPTIMISSISKEEGPQVLAALEAGAIDYIQKPSMKDLGEVTPAIIQSVKVAAKARVRRRSMKKERSQKLQASIDHAKVVVIGSSTGGTEALREIFESLPNDIPPIVVVQHIPAVFSHALAERLNTLCPFRVKEAEEGDVVCKNQILIAPGGKQLKLRKLDGQIKAHITDDAPVNRHKPSVDYMFDSTLEIGDVDWVAVILTGMGADGARAMLRLRQKGARTIAQDESSSVVYGMPREALKMGGVEFVLPIGDIAEKIMELTTQAQGSSLRKIS